MNSGSAERGLGGGRHVCLVHDSDSERERLLERWVSDGLAAGERVMLLADVAGDPRIEGLLGRTGPGSRDGQIDVASAHETYLPGGSFSADAMIDSLEGQKRAALADGFTGLRYVAEMGWAQNGGPGVERLADYERAANQVFADGRAKAICQYDHRRFGSDTLAAVASAHPLIASAFEDWQRLEGPGVVLEVGRHGTVRARGEIDIVNSHLLEQALELAAEQGNDVCVDASELTFVELGGLRALVGAARSTRVTLLAPGRSLRVMIDALRVREQATGLAIG